MDPNEFLDSIGKKKRPATNISGDFDCHVCREPVGEAYYDYSESILVWWCSEGHVSQIKNFGI